MFVAGPYTATYNDSAVGITENGFELDQTYFSEPITGDNMGSAHQDDVYRSGNNFISWTAQEWNAAAMTIAYWPWANFGISGQVGRLATSVAKTLLLTVTAGTNAAVAGPNTLTASRSILAPDFNVKHIFSTRHRKVPLRHKLYPVTGSESGAAAAYWFTAT